MSSLLAALAAVPISLVYEPRLALVVCLTLVDATGLLVYFLCARTVFGL